MRARRHGSLLRFVVLLVVALCGALVAALSQSSSASPVAAAADPTGPAPSGGRVEVVAKRTRDSATFRNPDGSMTTRVSSVPLHVRESGRWVPVDDALTELSDGTVETKATGYDLALPEGLTDPVAVSKGDAGVSFRLRGAIASERSVDGSTATFADARPGVDVEYTAAANAVKEQLVLADADAERSFAFDLDPVGDATPRLADNGGVDLVQPDGSVDARIAAPVMADAHGKTSDDDLRYTLRRDGDAWVLGLDADTSWLRDEDRAWPVKVDPSVSFSDAEDTYMANGAPFAGETSSTAGADAQYGPAGFVTVNTGGTRLRRAALRFNFSGVPKNAVINSAYMKLRTFDNDNYGGVAIGAYALKRGFTSAATWNKYDGVNAWTTPGGDFDNAPLDTQTVSQGWYSWAIGQAARDWTRDPSKNYGILLKAPTEALGGAHDGATFDGSSTGTDAPYIEVNWLAPIGTMPQWTIDTQQLDDRSQLGVNVATGNLIYTAHDIHVAGVGGMDLDLSRTFNSQSLWGDANFGTSWAMSGADDVNSSSYDNGRTIMIRSPGGAQWRFEKRFTTAGVWDGTWETPRGVNATFTTGGGGRKLVFNRTGETWWFADADGGGISWMEDKNGHRITYTYDAGARVVKVVDTRGRTFTFNHDTSSPNKQVTSITDAAGGRTWTYAYEFINNDPTWVRMASYTDPEGKTTTYGYQGTTLTSVTDPRGNKTTIDYDYNTPTAQGNYPVAKITRITNAAAGTGPAVSYSYDFANRKTTVTGPRGNAAGGTPSQFQTVYTYDLDDQVTDVTNPLGQKSQSEFNQNGDTTKFTSQFGGGSGTTPAISDATFSPGENNLTKTESPLNNGKRETTSSTYNTASTQFGGAAASPATGQYRVKDSTDAQGNTTAFEYDAAGNLTKASQSGMLIKADLAYTNGTETNTPPKGLLKTATDGKSQVTSYGYDAKGHLLTVKPPLVSGANPGEFAYMYEAGTSRRSKQTDASGATQSYTYDKLDRLKTIANGNGQTVTYGYDANGNLTSRSWAPSGGANATYAYDALNRMTSETVGGATTSYTYDDAGNLKTMTDGGGTTTYGYDRLNRVNSVAPPAGGTITAAYDDTSSPRTRVWTYPGGQKQTTRYSLSGKVLAVAATSSTSTAIAGLSYSYLAGANETVLRQQESQTVTAPKTTTYAYDQANRLCWATTKSVASPTCGTVPSGTGGTTWSYAWDAASNRTATKTDAAGTITRNDTYTHDAANRIVGQTYDSRGNLTAGSLSYDPFNRLSAAGSIGLAYGGPDNTELLTDGSTSLRNSQLGLTTSTTGGTATYYVRAPDGELLGERTSAGTRYAILDALGSTRWLLSGNTISKAYDYTPDGETTATGSGADTRIRFAGGDRTSGGLYRFGARFYNPTLARWTQRDALDNAGDIFQANTYLYAGADPVNNVDSDGDFVFLLAAPLVAGISGEAAAVGAGVAAGAAAGAGAGYVYSKSQDDNNEHTKNARPSSLEKHQRGQARQNQKNTDKKRSKPGWKQNPNKR